jgi:polysaccharide export outer membrane protein
MKKTIYLFFFMLMIVTSSLTSCVSQKKMLYFQNETMLNDSTFTSIEYENERHFDYKVQPGDILYIRIASLDEKFSAYFNTMNGNSVNTNNSNIYLNGYNIDAEGYIELPIVSRVQVKDYTVSEIQEKVQSLMNEYLTETVVYVKLGVFNLTILGEVANPGQYQVYQSDINIFQAIALAGNATDFANKSKIKIIHQTPKGSQIVRININDADVLSSPHYYLKPNDIVYVEPLKSKQYGFTTVPYGTIFSALSLIITCITFGVTFLKP